MCDQRGNGIKRVPGFRASLQAREIMNRQTLWQFKGRQVERRTRSSTKTTWSMHQLGDRESYQNYDKAYQWNDRYLIYLTGLEF